MCVGCVTGVVVWVWVRCGAYGTAECVCGHGGGWGYGEYVCVGFGYGVGGVCVGDVCVDVYRGVGCVVRVWAIPRVTCVYVLLPVGETLLCCVCLLLLPFVV